MYAALARHVLYPAADTLTGARVTKYLLEFEETQWWDRERLRELQNDKLRALVKHAYQNVPYYRRVMDERGLSDKDIRSVEDLPNLPILTKGDIRRNFDDLKATGFHRWRPFLNATSGSTGEPLRYYIDINAVSAAWAGTFRGWEWAGYKLGDKRVTLAGSSLVSDKRPSLTTRLRWLIERNLPLSAVHMDKQTMAVYASRIAEYAPRFLRGYPSALYTLALYLEQQGIRNIRPNAVFTTAEVLLPHQREAISGQFGCDVFDHYSCFDGGPQAMECAEHAGYHVSVERAVVELVDARGRWVPPGCAGEIISTDLYNYAMPFIRYAVGDRAIGSDEHCPCGRSLPLIRSIEGRTTDVIALGNGVTLSGPALTLAFKDCRIHKYQVVQEGDRKLVIKVVKAAGYTTADTERFLGIIRHHAGEGIDIDIQYADDIPTTAAGKYRFIIGGSPREGHGLHSGCTG
jgi:phenylacetate-CoA ligase